MLYDPAAMKCSEEKVFNLLVYTKFESSFILKSSFFFQFAKPIFDINIHIAASSKGIGKNLIHIIL